MDDPVQQQFAELRRLGYYHSIELPDGSVIPGLQTLEQLRTRVDQFQIPKDLRGKRVLDIGAWDGWFSFEMERRGAEVVAFDYIRQDRFLRARDMLGSKVQYEIGDICRVRPERLGRFDIVLFLGVLYHVKHPVLALETVCELSTDMVCVESYVSGTDLNAPPAMAFYETRELRGQFDNWVGPNVPCLLAMCRTAGFARVQFESVLGNRAHVSCYRHWGQQPGDGPAPYVTCVENSVTCDHSFSRERDDYVAFWFKSERTDLTSENVYPEIGKFGTRAVVVSSTGGDGWHANCKLPPGLDADWAPARIRVADSGYSNTVRIPIDIPPEQRVPQASAAGARPEIMILTDGRSWERNRVRIGLESCLSVWARGIPEGTRMSDVTVRLNGTDLPAIHLSETDPNNLRQVNVLLPAGMGPGRAQAALAVSGSLSESVDLELVNPPVS